MDYNARFYDPYLNRFIQPDSIVPNPTNPQSWNRYAYVNNSPINFSDPSGHVAIGANENEICLPGSDCDPMQGSDGWENNGNSHPGADLVDIPGIENMTEAQIYGIYDAAYLLALALLNNSGYDSYTSLWDAIFGGKVTFLWTGEYQNYWGEGCREGLSCYDAGYWESWFTTEMYTSLSSTNQESITYWAIHEMTHLFDRAMSYDSSGNVRSGSSWPSNAISELDKAILIETMPQGNGVSQRNKDYSYELFADMMVYYIDTPSTLSQPQTTWFESTISGWLNSYVP